MSSTFQGSSKTSSKKYLSDHYVLRGACAKQSNHSLFIPVSQLLSCQTTAVGHVSKEILEIVLHLACWVVRVRMLNTKADGAASTEKWSTHARTCTGVVTSVGEHYVTVQMQQIAVEFFYDSDDFSNVITIRGLSMTRDVHSHLVQLTCHSCPELRQRFQSTEKTGQWHPSLMKSLELDCVQNMEGSMAVLISHPHGFSKRVSFGHYGGTEVQVNGERALPAEPRSRTSTSAMSSSVSTFSLFKKCPKLILDLLFSKLYNKVVLVCFAMFQTIVNFIFAILNRLHIYRAHRITHDRVRVFHTAASCPGSSGGAILLVGQQVWTEVVEGLRLFPVMLHVGMMMETDQGVAVPLVAIDSNAGLTCYREREEE